MALCIVFVY